MSGHTDPWHKAKDQIDQNQAGIGLTQVTDIGTLDNKAERTNGSKNTKESCRSPCCDSIWCKNRNKNIAHYT